MFAGIIEEIGSIESVQSDRSNLRLRILASKITAELQIGDSVCIDGVCQTVVSKTSSSFDVQSVEETLKKTTVGTFKKGSRVNLELPLRLNERIGGHIVLGHIDTVGTISNIEPREGSRMFSISFSRQFDKYVVPVGSIAVDGVSLTVAQANEGEIRVSIIPHTLENTVFKFRKIGDSVNLEFDILGKYAERLIEKGKAPKNEEIVLSETRLGELRS